METNEQHAFLWTIGHEAWIAEESAGVAEGNFDTWVPFLMDLCVQLTIPTPREQDWPL